MRKCIRGNKKAQNLLYQMYKHLWYKVSLRYAQTQEEAQDILQEGLIRIFCDLQQYDSSKSQFSTWSTKVIVNAAIRYLKRNQWHKEFSDISEASNTQDKTYDAIDLLSEKELTHLISKLPTGYRLVFNMYVIEGYKHHEIASKLDISEGTSKSQLSKAKKMLRTNLETLLLNNV